MSYMYNKIFTKILDSSIWLETDATRLVWITMLAAMDEDGFCQFASVANLARRAVVDLDKAEEAVRVLESPDKNSADPDNEGRRIERVPGGWMVLNAGKYRELVTRIISREQTRVRVARHRMRNAPVTHSNKKVTPSEALSESEANTPIVPKGDDVALKMIFAFFHRRETTALDGSEKRALQKNRAAVDSTSKEDWELLAWFYALPEEGTYRRKNVATLLNNWNAEIDRARAFRTNHRPATSEQEARRNAF